MYYVIRYEPELYHYGVKGMRWGVRHDPERVGRRKSSGKTANKKRGLSKNQKIALGVAALAVTGVVLYKTGKYKSVVNLGNKVLEAQLGGSGSNLNLKKLGRDFNAIQKDSKMIGSINAANIGKPGGDNNCFHTSTSYILNSLFGKKTTAKLYSGIDESSGLVTAGRDWKLFNSIFDGIKTTDYRQLPKSKPVAFLDAINDIKPGSTGVIHLDGHYINYEKSKRGILTIIDSQADPKRGQVLEVTDEVAKYLGMQDGYKVNRILDFSNASLRKDANKILKNIVKQ